MDNWGQELSGMAINLLTDKEIRAAFGSGGVGNRTGDPGNRTRVLNDGGGLTLIPRPGGIGWWRFRYSFGGRENRLSLGTYPVISLADARARRDEARRLVANGTDPSAARQAQKAERKARVAVDRAAARGEPLPGSFEAVAREWWETIHTAKVSEGHAERTLIRLKNDVFPWLGARPIGEIEAPELLQCLRRVEARGAIETAHRVKDACGQVFRYGIVTGHCQRNPAADLREALKPVPTRHHAAIVDPKQAGELLRDMMDYVGHPVTRAALRLSALLMLRPGELRQMQWAWIDFDEKMATIPAEAMKRTKAGKTSGVPHHVPLADQAIAVLRDELLPLTGGGRYVFPGLHSAERPMSENTANVALRRMGYDRDTMTAHGFRAMARTLIAERLNVATEVIEAQLAHAVPDALGRAYNRTQYLEQRREMMTLWAGYLDRLREGAQVVPIRPRVA